MSAAFGDYDRDGDVDLFLTHWSLGGGNPITAPHLWHQCLGRPKRVGIAELAESEY